MSKRRRILAAVAAGAAFTGVLASAASLGGITAQSLGADVTTVASCDPNGVTLAYTTAYSGGVYKVTGVTVAGIAAGCNTFGIKVTLGDASNTSLGEATGVVGGTSVVLAFGTPISANPVTNAAVIISG
jgi:hypothetical protein